MAERDIDKLLSMTDSKYRLSVVTAKRALQLRSGAPSVLPVEQRVRTRNLVTQAMRELATGKLTVGTGLMDEQRFHQDYVRQRQAQLQAQLNAERERERD
ncbi:MULTISPECIES: DNA-directed RNA polymerase subunit omega [Deinococcus]|jgi:DNA-directed RNA polymerase subunit omega|uniref:DNA-directed RNA polymerase subunit omega n=2 Tax=Deinococcus TaxID=1298 RepID=A0A221ST96_9DEIO|nr:MULTISPECIES: DNA-directed RNA polymerase subunit omega [Deinococcus]ASN79869.1 DNA-directed RNA polymerase subunit omega [Deinococcus ficus]MDP9766245.1 DNA-directed RNA polymerase subunit omega [Deinococcus enclensis]